MGLRASDFNLEVLKGKDIVGMRVDRRNESTITLLDKKTGKTERHRIPATLVRLLEFYAGETTLDVKTGIVTAYL